MFAVRSGDVDRPVGVLGVTENVEAVDNPLGRGLHVVFGGTGKKLDGNFRHPLLHATLLRKLERRVGLCNDFGNNVGVAEEARGRDLLDRLLVFLLGLLLGFDRLAVGQSQVLAVLRIGCCHAIFSVVIDSSPSVRSTSRASVSALISSRFASTAAMSAAGTMRVSLMRSATWRSLALRVSWI